MLRQGGRTVLLEGIARHITDRLAAAETVRARHAALQRDGVDLSALPARAVANLQQVEPGRQVQVAIQPDLQASGDRRLLDAALPNLIGNAWMHTGALRQPQDRTCRRARPTVSAGFASSTTARALTWRRLAGGLWPLPGCTGEMKFRAGALAWPRCSASSSPTVGPRRVCRGRAPASASACPPCRHRPPPTPKRHDSPADDAGHSRAACRIGTPP